MSYILEALKKSDAERKRGEVPTLGMSPALTAAQTEYTKSRLPWVLASALAVCVVALGAVLVLRPNALPAPLTFPVRPAAPAEQPKPSPEPQIKPEPIVQPQPVPKPEPVVEPEPEPVAQPEPVQAPIVEPVDEPIATEPAPAPVTIYKPTPKPEPEPQPTPETAPQAEPEPVAVVVATPIPPSTPKPTLQTAPKPRQTAKVFVDRAWASIDKGFYNQALRDLNKAVELEPSYADAWFARGWTNEKSGSELSAIGDYGRAITAQPNHAFALFSRGYLNLYIGSAQSAVTDFIRTQGVAADQSLRLYSHLWLYLSRMRVNQDADVRLNEDTAGENLDLWPGPLVRYFLGHMDEDQTLTVMEDGAPETLLERRCTGHFFLGIRALSRGDKDRARSHFEKTLATGAIQFRQYDAAKRELDILNQ